MKGILREIVNKEIEFLGRTRKTKVMVTGDMHVCGQYIFVDVYLLACKSSDIELL